MWDALNASDRATSSVGYRDPQGASSNQFRAGSIRFDLGEASCPSEMPEDRLVNLGIDGRYPDQQAVSRDLDPVARENVRKRLEPAVRPLEPPCAGLELFEAKANLPERHACRRSNLLKDGAAVFIELSAELDHHNAAVGVVDPDRGPI